MVCAASRFRPSPPGHSFTPSDWQHPLHSERLSRLWSASSTLSTRCGWFSTLARTIPLMLCLQEHLNRYFQRSSNEDAAYAVATIVRMWIKRTPEEVAKWHEVTARDARSHGRLIGGMVWVLVSLFGACGWFVSLSAGFAMQRSVAGSFWVRLLVIGVIVFPFAYWVFRRERRSELQKLTRRTICPKCDASSESNDGTACECGGAFVPQSTMKWIDE